MTEKKLTEDRAKEIFDNSQIPASSKPALPAFALYAEIDTTPQLLRYVRPFHLMMLTLPPGLAVVGREVIIRLFRCFAKAGTVSEGLVGDIMSGFAEDTVEERGLPPEATWMGIQELWQRGFLKFQAKDNSYVDPQSDKIYSAWVRYTPKLLELVYERKSI